MKIIILLMFSLSLLVNCGGGKDTQTKTDKSHKGHTHSTDPADKMAAGEDLVYSPAPWMPIALNTAVTPAIAQNAAWT